MKEIPVLIFHTKDNLSLRSAEISLDLDKLVHLSKTLKIKLKLQITKENSMVSFIQALFVFILKKKYCQLFWKWVTILCTSFCQRLKKGRRLSQKRANISHDMSQTPQIDNSIVEWFRWGGRAEKNQTYCKFVNWCLFYLLHFHCHFKIGTLFKPKMLTMDYENWRYIDSVNQLLSQKILFKKPQNEICRSVKPSVEGWVSFEGFMWDNNWFWAQALCAVNWKYEKEKKNETIWYYG